MRLKPGWGGLLFGLAIAAASAHAAEDGGTRSALSESPAGVRALGMGSAVVASVDDASALLWNPAGLGRVRRGELQATQAGDPALGVSDTYVSLVLPSWRWGAAALAFRHHGVNGLEARDQRNQSLGEFEDSETEIALGYGRALNDGMSLGGALRAQRQSLAGLGSLGIGMDLGLEVRPARFVGGRGSWAEAWSWAVSVRNAIEPTLRLDREGVADPRVMRTGLAYRAPAGLLGAFVGELDVEKARGEGARLRAGIEYRALPMLAFRAGSDGSAFTAGTGLRWRDLGLEYAYRDNPIAAEHHVGVTLAFGATLEEGRMAAQRREEAALERRLEASFSERQARELAGLKGRAETARAAERWDDALEALAAARTLVPDDLETRSLEAACWVGRAAGQERAGDFATAILGYDQALKVAPGDSAAARGARRARLESDRRAARSTALRSVFGHAMDAFASGELGAARSGFARVVEQEPGDGDARAMLRRTEIAIARSAASLVAEARDAIQSGRMIEAGDRLNRAAALDAMAPGLATARATLQRSIAEAARASTPGAPAPPSPARAVAAAGPSLTEGELEDLYRRGLDAQRRQRPDDALRYWQLVQSARPGYRGVDGLLKREHLTRGMEAFAAGAFEDAIAQWREVLRLDPEDARARGYLDRAESQMARSREILGGGR